MRSQNWALTGVVMLLIAAPSRGGDLYVDDDGICGGNLPCHTTIQGAIDAAIAGDTIHVYPGTYNLDEANGRDPLTGGAGSNDFNIFVNKALLIQGVDGSGAPITSSAGVLAQLSSKRNVPAFGTSNIFVQADDVTITGLEVSGFNASNNKTIEVGADNFTLKDCKLHGRNSVCLYISDFHYDAINDISHLQSYHIEDNEIDGGGISASGVRLSSGAGWTGGVANRVITGNAFSNNSDAIVFAGPGAAAWEVYPVGDALITGNSFAASDRRHVIAWGIYNANLGYINPDWHGILANNTFDKAAITWTPLNDARIWNSGAFQNIRGLYSAIQRYAVNRAQAGDTVEVVAGTYVENITIAIPLTLLGAQAGVDARTRTLVPESVIIPDVSSPDPDAGPFIALIYLDASNVTIDGFTIDGDNPGLTSGLTFNGADIDAEDGIAGFEASYQNITIKNNIIRNLSYTGIDLYPGGSVACNGNSITHNRVENLGGDFGDIGILIYNTFYAAVDENVVVDADTGIQTGNFHLAGSPASISSNEVAARGVGIFHNLHYSNASAFTIANNTVTATTNPYADASSIWAGAILWSHQGTVTSSFTNNTFDGSGSNNPAKWGFSIWNLPTSVTPTITGGSISGVDIGAYIRNHHPTWGDSNLPGTNVSISGVDISATTLGIWVQDSPSNTNNATTSATITADTEITTAASGTAILVQGTDASASITNNSASIHGNLIGIDVNGGSATISGNHIYDNGTGVRFTNAGTGSVTGNDFNDTDDNDTDLRLDASAGTVTIGAGNSFAGEDYFIDNRTAQVYDLTGGSAQTYDQASNFRIEDRMYHALDAATSGRITWHAANRYVTTPGTGLSDETIQRAINAADAYDTVNVESGTFTEVVYLNKDGIKVIGQGAGVTTINYEGQPQPPGANNGGVYSNKNEVELRSLSVTRTSAGGAGPSVPRYGIKFDFASDMVVDGVTVDRSFRTGLDLHGVTDAIVNDVTSLNNGGAGIFMTDVKGAALSNITTSGNPWVGVSVATSGQFVTYGTDDIVFSGTNSFGESTGRNGGLQLEAFEFAPVPPAGINPITWSSNPADGAMVTILPADFGYALSGSSFTAVNTTYVRFYQTLAQAQAAAALTNPGGPDHIANVDRYIQEADDSNGLPNSGPTDLYVFDNASDTMSIQAAIDAAWTGATDTIHIGAGSYAGNADATARSVILSAGASPAQVTINGNLVLDGNDTLPIELTGTNPATQYDNFIVNGTVTLGGATLNLTSSFTPGIGTVFTIIDNDSFDPVSGIFSGLPEGSVITLSGVNYVISYMGGTDNNDVTLSVHPGPATLELYFTKAACGGKQHYKPGETVTARIRMKNLGAPAAGFQAFLHFDTTKLSFVSGSYISTPFGLPVIFPITAVGDEIDVASGINQGIGQTPTQADSDLVTLTFTAIGPNDCTAASTLTFRSYSQPSRVTDINGLTFQPLTLINAPAIAIDGTAPVVTANPPAVADCYPDVASAEAAALTATTATDSNNCTADGDLVKTVSTTGTCNATVRVTVTDCANNSDYVEYNTRIDNVAPIITCPANHLNVYADAGHCSAVVAVGVATATDNCDLSPTIDGVRSDNLAHYGTPAFNDPYPIGTTTIHWTATDHPCGHVSSCDQTITVLNLSELVLTLRLDGNDYPNNLERCIHLELYDCDPMTPHHEILDEVITFPAIPDIAHPPHTLAQVTTTIEVPALCGAYTCITARDPLHTLRRTLEAPAFTIVGTQYVADFVAANKPLLGGNLNGDPYIDILDFGVYVWQYNQNYYDDPPVNSHQSGNTTCSTPYPHADISGNGNVFTEDFTFIQINFLQFNDNNCCGGDYNRPAGPVETVTLAQLNSMGMGALAVSDLNGDAVVDVKDVAAWMQGARPGKPLPTPPTRRR